VQEEFREYLQTNLNAGHASVTTSSRQHQHQHSVPITVPVEFWSRSVSDDFAALTQAQALIGSVSSFSLWAAVLHQHRNRDSSANNDNFEGHAGESGSGDLAFAFLPVCDLFFHKQKPDLPGVMWRNVVPVPSRELHRLSVETIVSRLKQEPVVYEEPAFE
jgi:hypothetical protein